MKVKKEDLANQANISGQPGDTIELGEQLDGDKPLVVHLQVCTEGHEALVVPISSPLLSLFFFLHHSFCCFHTCLRK